uniref:DUF834 domain-containing protein n=1 Tax=Oryza meridionalis TaxID=40149 RepID=A0A0E0FBD9_9ORYZ
MGLRLHCLQRRRGGEAVVEAGGRRCQGSVRIRHRRSRRMEGERNRRVVAPSAKSGEPAAGSGEPATARLAWPKASWSAAKLAMPSASSSAPSWGQEDGYVEPASGSTAENPNPPPRWGARRRMREGGRERGVSGERGRMARGRGA